MGKSLGDFLLSKNFILLLIIMQKLDVLFCLVAVAMGKGTTKAPAANKIRRVEVFTSDCFQCGMSALGKIGLDNFGKDDFNRGTISKFTGATIGHCNGYDLGKTMNEISMKITHSGSDGGKFKWVQVYADHGHWECFFSSNLDNNQSEIGHGCKFSV